MLQDQPALHAGAGVASSAPVEAARPLEGSAIVRLQCVEDCITEASLGLETWLNCRMESWSLWEVLLCLCAADSLS